LPAGRRPYSEPVTSFSLGRMDVLCLHCGAKHWMDKRIQASSKTHPEFGRCCHHNQVQLPSIEEPPHCLRALFTGTDPQSMDFREHICQYNAALVFTSFNVNMQNINTGGRGPWIWKMGYQLYHQTGSLLSLEGRRPTYAQLIFYDSREALDERMGRNCNLRRDTMELLQNILFESHRYTRVYQHALQVLEDHDVEDISVWLIADPIYDQRWYNLPTTDEVAVIVCGDKNQVVDSRNIILRCCSGLMQRINDTHPTYAPLHYVLLFPWGSREWTYTRRLCSTEGSERTHTQMTQVQFYSYQLHIRNDGFALLHRGGRLFQQYICNVWVSTDQNRL
ncbi:hypothetical protein BC835DRAFT_1289763, partial [Cytidiella melzeri]